MRLLPIPTSSGLVAEERQALVRLARESLEACVQGSSLPPPPPRSPGLDRLAGAFVSVRWRDELRGCLGSFEATHALWFTVREMAQSAATRDPRFEPLRPAELPETRIEITILANARRICGPEDVLVGRDGLMVRVGTDEKSGLLLPQVAVERGWDGEEFLAATCAKAGLDAEAWRRQDAELWSFGAEVISEANLS